LSEKEEIRVSRITVRALLIGLILNIFFTVVGVMGMGFMTEMGPASAVATIPTMLILFVISMIAPYFRFSAAEIIIIYIMTACFFDNELLRLTFPRYLNFAIYSPYQSQIAPLMPKFWFPEKQFMEGMLMGGASMDWSAWSVPLTFWLLYSFSLVSFNLCFNLILSHRMIVEERLSFPQTQALLQLISEPKKPLKERTGWKFLVSGLIVGFIVNSTFATLPMLIPRFPEIWPKMMFGIYGIDLGPIVGPNNFLNQILYLPLLVIVPSIATFFLVPTSITGTALITHFILWNIIPIIECKTGMMTNVGQFGLYSIMGWYFTSAGTALEPTGIQMNSVFFGLILGMALTYLVLARGTLKDSFMAAIKGGKTGPYSSRLLWSGFLVSMIVYIALNLTSSMPIQTAIFFVFANLLSIYLFTRVMGELGPVGTRIESGLMSLGVQIMGGEAVRGQSAMFSTLALGYGHSWGLQGDGTVRLIIQTLRIAEATKTRWKGIVAAGMLTFIISTTIAFVINLWGMYTFGLFNRWVCPGLEMSVSDEWATTVLTPGTTVYPGVEMRVWPELIAGFVVSVILVIARLKFVWFPFHPIGVLVASFFDWAIVYWFGALIALIMRLLVLRIGGAEVYEKKGVPFVTGLLVGYAIDQFIVALIYLSGLLS